MCICLYICLYTMHITYIYIYSAYMYILYRWYIEGTSILYHSAAQIDMCQDPLLHRHTHGAIKPASTHRLEASAYMINVP